MTADPFYQQILAMAQEGHIDFDLLEGKSRDWFALDWLDQKDARLDQDWDTEGECNV